MHHGHSYKEYEKGADLKKLDLSQGNIRRLVVQTAVPMVAAQFVSMLYNIVDRIFVGRMPEIGAVALGGIGIYLPINIIFMAVSLLFGGGGATQTAIALGAGDRKKAEKYLGCCFLPLILSGLIFGICLFWEVNRYYLYLALPMPIFLTQCSM